MTGIPDVASTVALDEKSVVALREILDDPSLAVGTTPDGPQIARLREALDHLVTVRAGAAAIGSPEAGRQLLASLAALDAELADVLRWHVTAVEVLSALEPGRARNAVLGDIGRGDLVTFAADVRAWSWGDGAAPSPEQPLRRARGEVGVDHFPGLYNTVLAWKPSIGGLIAIPTHRQGVSWKPADGDVEAGHAWVVTLAGVTFHADDLIRLDRDPRSAES
ncbi:hypothetical protein GCM10009555_095780 [Acrocarpospora macrocephala]|uniref:Uncharacterized protein n=1 Tax=Acrocarpospora macrocephala TaxID=150177 RepID=A0A5M3WJX2_9ACTN|nr:hypothetical protein [Acrocarpospora macrocephala]GES09477.1 hypothetical protein Amac_030730 [Acrocarpospora macrocephala]